MSVDSSVAMRGVQQRSGVGDRTAEVPTIASLAGVVASLALTLLALLDLRRGFLFAQYAPRSAYYAFNPWQAVMLAAGIAGLIASHRALRRLEARTVAMPRSVKALTFIVFALLVADLFAYRGVPAARSIAAGRINVDWLGAFGVTDWWRPFAQATSYLLNVWHATMIGVLMSGLVLTILPRYLEPYFVRPGFTGSLVGALFALPQPFCSCCSSVMAPSFVRRGASTNFLLSFVVGAPMLNVTTLFLAVALLPAPFALVRIVAGMVVTVLVTYVVARAADRWDAPNPAAGEAAARAGGWRRIGAFYERLFDVEGIVGGGVDTPSDLIARWLRASGRIALILVPTLWGWSVVAAVAFQALPSAFGNNLPSVVAAAVGGTLFMISTWSEIPMALRLIQSGWSGPAAALLVVLPAVSLPCIVVLGGALQRFRMVALLAAAVMVVGIVAGAIFLLSS